MATGGDKARSNLGVLVDGVALPADEARALWERFSEWMEEHRGDLAGFAAREGFVSIHPGVEGGRPVLLASKTAAQRPYGPATAVTRPVGGKRGGSSARHETPGRPRPSGRKSKK
jgi:hypothetical protein